MVVYVLSCLHILLPSIVCSARFLLGGEHGRLKYPPPDGHSTVSECLLPFQVCLFVPFPSSPFKTLPSLTFHNLYSPSLQFFLLLLPYCCLNSSSLLSPSLSFILLFHYHLIVMSCLSSFKTFIRLSSHSTSLIRSPSPQFLYSLLVIIFNASFLSECSMAFNTFWWSYLSFYILPRSPLIIHLFSFPTLYYSPICHATLSLVPSESLAKTETTFSHFVWINTVLFTALLSLTYLVYIPFVLIRPSSFPLSI